MTRLGRFTVSTSLLAALLALPCVCQAAPESILDCQARADLNYQLAVSAGSPDADMVHEDTMVDCEDELNDFAPDTDPEFRAWQRARLIAEARAQALREYKAHRARLVADPAVSLNELVTFDQDGQTFFVEAGWN